MPSTNNKKKAIQQQQQQRRETEVTINVDYIKALIQEESLEYINLSYGSFSQQNAQLDRLCDYLLNTNWDQMNERNDGEISRM